MKHEQKPKGRDHDIKTPKAKYKMLSLFIFLGFCNRMEIFQVETGEGSSHGDQASDSDEFDHFFD